MGDVENHGTYEFDTLGVTQSMRYDMLRGNETGKVAIAHGSVEFCEVTPIGLADESYESLYGRETDRDHLRDADLRSA